MKNRSVRLFGILFILSFISYATGIGLMEVIQSSVTPGDLLENKTSIISGAILIALGHTVFNIGLLAIMFTILRSIHPSLSILYLVLGSLSTLMLVFGVVFLLLPLPIHTDLSPSSNSEFSFLLSIASRGNFYCYQLGMAIWGVGGIVLCYVLCRAKLLPTIFPFYGSIGYIIFIIGCGMELTGFPYGILCSLPGGLFEIALSLWLIVKGFRIPHPIV